MEYIIVDIDEDAEEFSSRTLHLALQPTNSAPKFVLGTSLTSQIKINSSKQCQKKTCANGGDRYAWRIKEVNLCIILYRNI